MKMLQDDQTKNILLTLRKNSLVLKNLLGKATSEVIVTKNELQEAGFRFNYITDSATTKKGSTAYFCYGYAYFILEHEQYLLMRRKDVPE
nr:hypothetical protein [uncultured Lacibacter sp.]